MQILDPAHPRHVADLEISQSDDGCVITRPGQEQIHFLNPTAVLILELCNGQNTPEQIVASIQGAYGLPEAPVDDVSKVLDQLRTAGLLV